MDLFLLEVLVFLAGVGIGYIVVELGRVIWRGLFYHPEDN